MFTAVVSQFIHHIWRRNTPLQKYFSRQNCVCVCVLCMCACECAYVQVHVDIDICLSYVTHTHIDQK